MWGIDNLNSVEYKQLKVIKLNSSFQTLLNITSETEFVFQKFFSYPSTENWQSDSKFIPIGVIKAMSELYEYGLSLDEANSSEFFYVRIVNNQLQMATTGEASNDNAIRIFYR